MKKNIYIILVITLFILLAALFVSSIEFLIIKLMISDFDKYSLGLTWNSLVLIRNTLAITVLFGFSVLGYFISLKWWKYVYVDKKYKIK